MPLISSSIPNLINGVSQQPAALRLASQCEQMVNCLASPVEGLRKRPPAQHIAKLFNGSAGAGRPFTTIVDRDGSIKYLVLIQDNAIKVFGLDGSVKTVSTPDGTSYLDITGEPSSTFRAASVADYTFIVNREKTVAMSGTTSPTWGTKSMVFIRSAEYGTTYSITVNATTVSYETLPAGGKRLTGTSTQTGTTATIKAVAHGLATGDQVDMTFSAGKRVAGTYTITVVDADHFTYTAPNSVPALTGTYSQSGTAVSVSINSHGFTTGDQVLMDITSGTGVDGTYEVTVSNANNFTYTAGTSLTTSGNCTANAIVNSTVVHEPNYSPSTVEIAAALKAALATALGGSWTITNGAGQYVVRIAKNDGTDYTLASTDTKTGLATVAIKGTIDSISDLPVTAEHGFIVEIVGAAATGADDYYVKFVANAGSGFGHGIWQETVAPGIPYLFDATTMPHVLIRNNDGTFTFQKFTWSGRVAGDTLTAPNPSFVGSQIQNINLFRNRLVLLADENVITSAADSYDRFWPESAQTIVDSDPIDLSAGSRKVNFLMASVAFSNVLLLFSRHGQFRLDSGSSLGQTLTPKTASVTQVTAFEMGDVVDPVIVGRTMYFAIPRGEYNGLREFFLPDASGPVPSSEEVTSSVPRFLPGNLCNLVATAAEEAVYLVSKDQPTRVYGYKFLFEGDKKLQSAWGYWETNGGKSIIGIDMVDSDLYLVVQYSNGVYLERVVTQPESVDTGSTVELLLDRKATEASCTVALTTPSGLDTQSTITLPYPIDTANAQMAVVGRVYAGNSLMHGQSVQIISSTAAGGAGGMGTLTVRGDLTAAKFYVGETYNMLYEFSAQFLKEQPPGGGMAVIAGPKLQLRTWTVVFDKSSAFNLQITPRGRDTQTYPYTGFEIGDQEVALGELALRTSKFRVPVMAQNIEAKIEVTSSSPLPCRLQSAEWEGWYHTRSARL
jgi:hypothetical protein